MEIYTGSYSNCKSGNLVSISGDKGKSADFYGNYYLKLAPKRDFFKLWRTQIGIVPEWENNLFYMNEFYTKVLKNLDPKEVLDELSKFGDKVILLCYENNLEFCHRHLVAIWLEVNLNIEIKEIKIDENGNMIYLPIDTRYTEEFKKIMNNV